MAKFNEEFENLEKDAEFRLEKDLKLYRYGPQCTKHGNDMNCTFTKTTCDPRVSRNFTNAMRNCDSALFDFSDISCNVRKTC